MFPKTIQKLIELFADFPGVGPKTASRFVFYLAEKTQNELENLAKAIPLLKTHLKTCNFCFRFFDISLGLIQSPGAQENLCEICSDTSRNGDILCVVENQVDLVSIEKNKIYKGLYFVLGGTVNNLKQEQVFKIKIRELVERIKAPENFGMQGVSFKEIIIATNPTIDGEATALLLETRLRDLNKKTRLDSLSSARRVTRLGRGLPIGGELEYADRETLLSAFNGRR